MAITYIPFNPSNTTAFSFQAILDKVAYNITVTWNVFGQRYYINIYTMQGALVVCCPLIGSPPGYDISMVKNRFTSTLVYRTLNNQFEVSDTPISYPNFGQLPASGYGGPMLDGNLNPFILDQSYLS